PFMRRTARVEGAPKKRRRAVCRAGSRPCIQILSYRGHMMDNSEPQTANQDILLELTADLVSAYVSNNPVPAAELPNLIAEVHAALGRVGAAPEQAPVEKQKPAVNPKRSVFEDYIICLEDGKKFKSLKRHLMTH